MAVEPIPFYDLYGESFLNLDAGFVHVESIEKRSRDLDWEIQPHRHSKLVQIIVVFDNRWSVRLDDYQAELEGSWLVMIPPGVVHGFCFAPHTRGFVLSINVELMTELDFFEEIREIVDAIWQPMPIEFRDSRQIHRFESLLKMIQEEVNYNEPGSHYVIGQLLKLVVMTIARQKRLDHLHGESGSRETRILHKFRELIEEHFREQLSAKDYADKLFISVSTLTRICQQRLQTTPKQLIRQRALNESKRLLTYTRLSVNDIALTLGYKDVGYFCRQFKRHEGMTAGEFRENNSF